MSKKIQQTCSRTMIDYTKWLDDDSFLILLFHGVVPNSSGLRYEVRNYIKKHLVVDEFVSVLRGLLKRGRLVSLDDIVAANASKHELPKRSFAITFDDAFANNYSVAAPILNDLKVPATFYITTDWVDRNIQSWTDKVEQAMESVPVFELNLPKYGFAGKFSTAAEKIELLKKIREVVFVDSTIDTEVFVDEIVKHMGAGQLKLDIDFDQKMNWEQVRGLEKNDLFTIGGHTHTHPIMGHLSNDELNKEIDMSLDLLQRNTGKVITHYSYPVGLDYCYSDQVIAALKERDIVCCPTAEPGVNSVGDDLFHLKRVMVV